MTRVLFGKSYPAFQARCTLSLCGSVVRTAPGFGSGDMSAANLNGAGNRDCGTLAFECVRAETEDASERQEEDGHKLIQPVEG